MDVGKLLWDGWSGKGSWLSGKDSNLDQSLQRALCYHYTTGQAGENLTQEAHGAIK